jgi:hypothetical protein
MGAKTAAVIYNVPLILEDMATKGWLKVHLADRAGLSQMTIGRFLDGEFQTAPTAKAIAGALGRSVRRYIVSAVDNAGGGREVGGLT